MSVLETTLVFVGIPLAISVVIALLVFGASARRTPRYRPGRPYQCAPVWFLARTPTGDSAADRPALPAGGERPAVTAGADTETNRETTVVKGGARGVW
ncbi:MAG TPA: hypothetical protein VGR21_13490 [Cryptosporangiaceae bacterium]|nr:hypothetical protein [Cryptosporangiaceae bacterium]